MALGVFAADYTAPFATTAPTIDGNIDDIWSTAEEIIPAEVHGDDTMCTGYIKLLWTQDALYVLEVIKDSTMPEAANGTSSANSVDLWFSEKNTQTDSYDTDDGDYHICVNSNGVTCTYTGNLAVYDVIEYKTNPTSDGYVTEIKIPFITIAPAAQGHVIGFNISLNDDFDNDDSRDSYSTWMPQEGQDGYYWSSTYLNTVVFGDIPTETEEPVVEEAAAPAEEAPAAEAVPEAAAAPETPVAAAQTGDVSALIVLAVAAAGAGVVISKKNR
jgi:endo-1,4-beta-xylanase